jgi:hypothetical protein
VEKAVVDVKVKEVEVPVENEVIKVQKDKVIVDIVVMKPVEKPKEVKITKHI